MARIDADDDPAGNALVTAITTVKNIVAPPQISQIETFINEGVDAIVLLPTDGAALTDVAIRAMQAGIPVVNVDREYSSPFAARTTILGDNYGIGRISRYVRLSADRGE